MMLLVLVLFGLIIGGVSLAIKELSEDTGVMTFMYTVTYLSYQCIGNLVLFVFLNSIGFICMLILIKQYTFRFRNEKATDVIYELFMEAIIVFLLVVIIFAISLHLSSNMEISKMTTSGIIILATLIAFIQKYIQCLIKHYRERKGGEY